MSAAFDALAPHYDDDFTATGAARHLRARAIGWLTDHLRPGDGVLELGCGTGEDARTLGERGYSVTASDASPAMLAIARRKCAHLGTVRFAHLDLNHLGDVALERPAHGYALAFANFGVINCVHTPALLAVWLAERMRPGGMVCLASMSARCAWEVAWHGIHGDWRTALRRLQPGAQFQPPGAAEPIALSYPSPKQLAAAFAPHFELISIKPLGLALPPSDLHAALDRRPRLLDALARLDDLLASASPLAQLADHFWLTLRRTPRA